MAEQFEAGDPIVRPMTKEDLGAAGQVIRLAFGTYLGLPDPLDFAGGREFAETRWLADPTAALTAELQGKVVGSIFAANWGTVSFFGPLTVHPDYWDRRIGQRLLEPTMELFAQWGTMHAGLYTFPQSTKHLHLYQRFGFWPRFLTSIMSKPVPARTATPSMATFSAMSPARRESCLAECADLTDSIYDGLDVRREIRAVATQGIGDTILLPSAGRLAALAVCHWGAKSEAERGVLYVKFAAALPSPRVAQVFRRLLHECEALAAVRGMERIVAGVNTGRSAAYRALLSAGFRSETQGVTMHRPNEAGYDREDVYLLDDWR